MDLFLAVFNLAFFANEFYEFSFTTVFFFKFSVQIVDSCKQV